VYPGAPRGAGGSVAGTAKRMSQCQYLWAAGGAGTGRGAHDGPRRAAGRLVVRRGKGTAVDAVGESRAVYHFAHFQRPALGRGRRFAQRAPSRWMTILPHRAATSRPPRNLRVYLPPLEGCTI
jgi:hypothetical protein